MIDMDSHGLINLKLRTCLDIGAEKEYLPMPQECARGVN